jgi:hypothetical protein
MSDNVPPMTDAALLALLRFDPARDADPAAKARVLGRVQTTIGGLGGLAAQAASGTVPRGGRSWVNDSALLSHARKARSRHPLHALWTLAGKPAGLVSAALLLGGVGGAGLYAALAPPRERTVYIERPVAVPEPRPFAFDPFNRRPQAASREREAAESPKTRNNPAPMVSALGAERELLDRARKALARGDTPDAERALDLHARRHPTGLLLEEREALAIKVLVDVGRTDEARRRAVKFRERYPRSLFGPSVDEAIGTIR